MSKKNKIVIIVICLLLVSIIVLTFFVNHNSLLDKKESGNSFFIVNLGNESHEVTVEVFNSKNTSLFNESYISAPRKTISSQFPTKLTPGTYIEVTLDNNVTKIQTVSNDASDVMLSINIDMSPDNPFYLGLSVP
jgi:hypothetical protein